MPRMKIKKIRSSGSSHNDLYVKFSNDLKALVARSMAIMQADDISTHDIASMILTGLAKGGLVVEHVCRMTPGTFLAFVKLAKKEAQEIFDRKDSKD